MEQDFEQNDKRSDIFANYYRIGQGFFSAADYNELRLTVEAGDINVGLDGTSSCEGKHFNAKQYLKGTDKWDEGILLYAAIDRNDAVRLSGLLMAWADNDKLHGEKND